MFFDKEFYLTFFPNKFNKSIVGVRAIIIDKDRYLLVKRSSTDRHNPNKWEFPGGSLEYGEDIFESLKREIKEEVNLLISDFEKNAFITYHDVPKDHKSKYRGFRRYIFMYKCTYPKQAKIKISSEHSDFKWVTLNGANKLQLTEDTISFLNSVKDKV